MMLNDIWKKERKTMVQGGSRNRSEPFLAY